MRAPFVVVVLVGCAAQPAAPVATPIPVAPPESSVASTDVAPKPPPDRDGDGIPDDVDKCPNDPETNNGYEDDDGCPDAPKVVVTSTANPPMVEVVQFAAGSDVIAKESGPLVDAVVQVMKAHPEVQLLQVEGHADKGEKNPPLLSQKRADAVVKALVSKGIDASRVRAKGFGAHCLAPPKPNRRVELKVAKMNGAAVPASQLGCPQATAAGVVSDPVP